MHNIYPLRGNTRLTAFGSGHARSEVLVSAMSALHAQSTLAYFHRFKDYCEIGLGIYLEFHTLTSINLLRDVEIGNPRVVWRLSADASFIQ